MSDTKITFDERYTWRGGLGCWFSSREPTSVIVTGAVRMVRGKLFTAWWIKPTFKWPWISAWSEVWWTPVERDEKDAESMRRFKETL